MKKIREYKEWGHIAMPVSKKATKVKAMHSELLESTFTVQRKPLKISSQDPWPRPSTETPVQFWKPFKNFESSSQKQSETPKPPRHKSSKVFLYNPLKPNLSKQATFKYIKTAIHF